MKKNQLLPIVLILMTLSVQAHAADRGLGVDPTDTPVKISSGRMVYDEQGGTVIFMDDVEAEHGDLTLWSDKLTAFLEKGEGGASPDAIDHIVAEGNVRAHKGTSKGTCGKLTYYVSKQFLKMENDPVLKDGQNSLSGEVINFYVQENRSEVVGGKNQRVKAIFVAPGGAE